MMAGKPGFLSFSSLAGIIATVAPNPRSLSLPPVHPPCHHHEVVVTPPRSQIRICPSLSIMPFNGPHCPVCRMKSRVFSRNQIGLLPSSRTISCHFPVPLKFFTLVPSDNLQILVGVWSLLGKLGWAAFKGNTEHGGRGLSHIAAHHRVENAQKSLENQDQESISITGHWGQVPRGRN